MESARAPVPTRFASTSTSVRTPGWGGASPGVRTKTFAALEDAAHRDGALVRAGATQIWDVPLTQPALALNGDPAVA